MATPRPQTVYYLPGHGGQVATGLGEGILSRGFDVTGRETIGEFRKLNFGDQIAIVAEDLATRFWHEDAQVVANSFGAYLFLHAQTLLPPYVGRVLLLSPIVGEFENEDIQAGFIPPRATRLAELAAAGSYVAPKNCEIHVGEDDWQAVPRNVRAFGNQVGIPVTVATGLGHMLGKPYVSALLDRWLTPAESVA
jgi:pimeloyl-ACP methyl ester carboxylesterase